MQKRHYIDRRETKLRGLFDVKKLEIRDICKSVEFNNKYQLCRIHSIC